MQIQLKDRETITGADTYYTPSVDVSGMALYSWNLTVHSSSGTSQSFAITWQTSDNLEDWTDLGSAANQDTPGTSIESKDAKEDFYGRYVRAKITVGGTDPMFNYSLWMNTFASS